ncbi:hypothetical protein KQX54_005403 [Cotesia glomerata]|uniref:Uncharacterized protein n=1 Tax=Cotesia glomerata TaxID=32391 RepID=A0AAV7I772_COTGL|nr:hypothetical protein KQX54_005403 [Cotesia glomerata]
MDNGHAGGGWLHCPVSYFICISVTLAVALTEEMGLSRCVVLCPLSYTLLAVLSKVVTVVCRRRQRLDHQRYQQNFPSRGFLPTCYCVWWQEYREKPRCQAKETPALKNTAGGLHTHKTMTIRETRRIEGARTILLLSLKDARGSITCWCYYMLKLMDLSVKRKAVHLSMEIWLVASALYLTFHSL